MSDVETVRVAPNPDRRAGRLIRYHGRVEYVIEGPTDIPVDLASRLLVRKDVVESDSATAEETARAPYDPSDYSVPVVLAYAREHPDEIDAILTAEQAGKNRSGVVDALTPSDVGE